MEIKEAIRLLKDYNHWRRYDGEISESPKMPNPKQIGIAIDLIIGNFENALDYKQKTKQLLIDCANFIQPYNDGGNDAERLIESIDNALK